MMDQTLLALDDPASDSIDRTGFDIGWDHARHALTPPPQLMLSGTPVSQGWSAGRAVFGHRTLAATRAVRQWLELRLRAWREGAGFDARQLTPHELAQLQVSHCPVTRNPLGGAPDGHDAPVIVRLREATGYAAGNLLLMSRRAAAARSGLDAAQLLERVQRLARDGLASCDGLDIAAWSRLATLASLAQEMPQVQAVRVPLHALPPQRVRVSNPAQALQVLLTRRLQAAGWSRRARAVADLLPRPGLRHDFNLFVGALAARLMAIPSTAEGRELHWALEDAWSCARVQRRWAQFALQMTAAECEALAQQLAASELGGVRSMGREQASTQASGQGQGRALPAQGRLLRSPRRQATRPMIDAQMPAVVGRAAPGAVPGAAR